MKGTSFYLFLTMVLTFQGLTHFYLTRRALQAVPLAGPARLLLIALAIFLATAYIGGRILQHYSLIGPGNFLVMAGSFWIGFMFYLLLGLVMIDLLRLALHVFSLLPPGPSPRALKAGLALLLITASSGIVIYGYVNASQIKVRKLELRVGKKAGAFKQLKIAAASDLHMGTVINRQKLRPIVEALQASQADIILLAGDLVDDGLAPIKADQTGELLRELKAPLGVYACPGNHEYIGGIQQSTDYLLAQGVQILNDQSRLIAGSFYLIGRSDRSSVYFTGQKRQPLAGLMNGLDRSKPLILLDHQPLQLEEARENGIDLQLSGHTHAGQLWPVIHISRRLFELPWGYRQIGQTHYYVSSGAGSWGPPVRTGNEPEIVEITLIFD